MRQNSTFRIFNLTPSFTRDRSFNKNQHRNWFLSIFVLLRAYFWIHFPIEYMADAASVQILMNMFDNFSIIITKFMGLCFIQFLVIKYSDLFEKVLRYARCEMDWKRRDDFSYVSLTICILYKGGFDSMPDTCVQRLIDIGLLLL